MSLSRHGSRVRLTVDLTQYHKALVVGAEGVTIGDYGVWSRGSDRFVGVRFDAAGAWDILWKSLESADPPDTPGAGRLREQFARFIGRVDDAYFAFCEVEKHPDDAAVLRLAYEAKAARTAALCELMTALGAAGVGSLAEWIDRLYARRGA